MTPLVGGGSLEDELESVLPVLGADTDRMLAGGSLTPPRVGAVLLLLFEDLLLLAVLLPGEALLPTVILSEIVLLLLTVLVSDVLLDALLLLRVLVVAAMLLLAVVALVDISVVHLLLAVRVLVLVIPVVVLLVDEEVLLLPAFVPTEGDCSLLLLVLLLPIVTLPLSQNLVSLEVSVVGDVRFVLLAVVTAVTVKVCNGLLLDDKVCSKKVIY